MKRLLFSLFFALLALPAMAQLPPAGGLSVGNTPIQGGSSGQCLTISASNFLNSQACGAAIGPAGGVLSGTYPNPGFAASLPSATFGAAAIITGADGSTWASVGITMANGSVITNASGNMVLQSAVNSNLIINAQGAATLDLRVANNSVWAIGASIVGSRPVIMNAPLTYGGVALANSVTGTGSMVLSTSPTLVTPNIGAATATSLTTSLAIADTGYSYQVPLTGFSITLGNTTYHTILDPAGTLASGTITMPAAPNDGMIVDMRFSQIVTALTVAANGGQSIKGNPTSAAVGSQFTCMYRAGNTTWYC